MDALKKINLKDYDTVVATTQAAVNETMGLYLYAHPRDFAIYAILDDQGNVKELTNDPAKATCYLKGTIAPEQDPKGNYINIVNLVTDKGNQTVGYNITMQHGEFYYHGPGMPPITIKQDNANATWMFKMFVNLSMQDVAKSNLPDDLKKELQNVDENMFSIQQLYLDMNTAFLNSIEGAVFPALVQTPATQILKLYLIEQQKTNKPLFGVSVKFRKPDVPPPAFAPTYIDFCVTPYSPPAGKAKNPDLDTLNYLIMTSHHQAPKYPPQSFSFNWVDDPAISGAMAIKHDLFVGFIVDELNPVLKALCPIITCKIDSLQVFITPSEKASPFQLVDGGTTGKVASSSYSTKGKDSNWNQYYSTEMEVDYGMVCDVYLVNDTILLSGAITVSGVESTHTAKTGNGVTSYMDDTTFHWSVALQLYMDAANNGQLDIRIGSSDFNSPPTVNKKDKPFGVIGIKSIGDIREKIMPSIGDAVLKSLPELFNKANHFVFPGARTFAFKNPQFSETADLASDITYLDPNA